MYEGHPFRDAPAARRLVSTRMKPRMSRGATFAGAAGMAVFWNVVTWANFVGAIGDRAGWAIAVLLLFVAIGLVLAWSAVHAFLALLNPTVELEIGDARPALGETLAIHWRLRGKARRVTVLRIWLEALEEAKHGRGKELVTDQNVFVKLPVAATANSDEIIEGTTSIVIPSDAVPSFEAENNKIVWRITVTCEIPSWPDIDEEFVLDVVASRRARALAAA